MTITMDTAGRLVIPKEIRTEACLEPGMPLEVRCRDGVIEIEPEPLAVRFERKGRLVVAQPLKKVPLLHHRTVEQVRRDLRRKRDL